MTMDARFRPMLCEQADELPADADAWVLEPKFDGWRTIVHLSDAGVTVYGGRNGNSYSGKVPYIEEALRAVLPANTAIDGELIAPSGWGSVQSVMAAGEAHRPTALSPALTLVAFDVIELNGQDVRQLPHANRRQLLELIPWPNFTYLAPSGEASVECHAKMLDLGMEGSVIKRRDSVYVNSRSRNWLKLKAIASEDCTIIGFKPGESGRAGEVGAIEVELPSGVRTTASGMTDKVREDMLANPDKYMGKVVEIVHNGVMASGKLRHPRFKRMRDDRSPAPAPKPKAPSRPRAPRSGPWMRNYKLMGDDKLQGCVRELVFRHGDAYQRCIDKGGDLRQHIQVARDEAVSRGLAVPAFP